MRPRSFFEWHRDGRDRRPYYVYPRAPTADGVLLLATLYRPFVDASSGETLLSYTILTTDAGPELAWLHDRMPIVLNGRDAALRAWLDPTRSYAQLYELLRRPRADQLAWRAVSPAVGNVRNDSAQCVAPVASPERTIRAYFTTTRGADPAIAASGAARALARKHPRDSAADDAP